MKNDSEKKEYEEPIAIKKLVKPEEKKKKIKYKVSIVTPLLVYYSDEHGNGCETKNTWKDLKPGDEISL